ncbi:MAG TPA: DUF808 family protein, partial [Beijerinckiaceae bacterium]
LGTVAMVWVGGGILLHATHDFGWHGPSDVVAAIGGAAAAAVPALGGALRWTVEMLASAALGLVVGALLIPVVQAAGRLVRRLRGRPAAA